MDQEVEMVDSLEDFEMLDAKIPSALKNITQNSQFKKVSLELRGRQIASMIYHYFRVTGAHGTVRDYADLFSVTLHEGIRYKIG